MNLKLCCRDNSQVSEILVDSNGNYNYSFEL